MGSEKPPSQLKLGETSISEILKELEEGSVTSVDLAYTQRIEDLNHELHAVSEINPDALSIAAERDAEREKGEIKGILHGVPILIKDVFLTVDEMNTTCGFSGLLGAKPSYEATAIIKLRQQGAILLGKTTLTEWMNYRCPELPHGWSATGGQCLGIFHKRQSPAGTSNGSAVAVSAGLAPIALGTEQSGGIATPARQSGVVGLKPTTGLTSRYGVFIGNEYMDSVGVLAQNVLDAAHVLTAISGFDEQDPLAGGDPRDYTSPQPLGTRSLEGKDFREACIKDGLKGLRVAVSRDVIRTDDFQLAKFEEALEVMRSLGATIVDDTRFSEWEIGTRKKFSETFLLASRLHLKKNLEHFLTSFTTNPHNIHNLLDIISYTSTNTTESLGTWGLSGFQNILSISQKLTTDSDEYKMSFANNMRMGRQLCELLDKYECDIMVAPGGTHTAANYGGCPQVSVPLQAYPEEQETELDHSGLVKLCPGLPVGMFIVGRRFDDAKVIGAAYAFEQATQHRKEYKPVTKSDIEVSDLGLFVE